MGLGDASKWVFDEMLMPAAEKMIPQGAAELGQALFTGNAYVAYGASNESVPMGPEVGGQAIEAPSVEPAQGGESLQASYDAMLQNYASQSIEPPDRGMERE